MVREDREQDEESPLLSQDPDDPERIRERDPEGDAERDDHGFPIGRDEIERIMGDSHLDDRVSISSRQQEQLVGKGGLERWGRGRMSVYDEGHCLVICDEDGRSRSLHHTIPTTPHTLFRDYSGADCTGNVSVRNIRKKA